MIWFHVGTRKTGTTSLQETCARSREVLAEFDIHYPGTGAHHHNLIEACKNYKLHSAISELDISSKKTTVFSTEYAEHLTDKEKISFIDTLLKFSDDVFVIIYLRDPVSLATSSSQQAIKMRRRTYEECCEKPLIWPYRRQLTGWTKAIDSRRLIVRKFESGALHNNSIIDDFFISIGHPDCVQKLNIKRSNESISLNAALLISEHIKLIRRGVDDGNIGNLLNAPGPRFRLPDWTVGFIQGSVAPQLKWLEQEFNIVFESIPSPTIEIPNSDLFSHFARINSEFYNSKRDNSLAKIFSKRRRQKPPTK